MGPLVVDPHVIGVTIYTPKDGAYILVVVLVELRFNALSSLSSTLLPPLFFFLLSSPSLAAHHFPPLTARPPAVSSFVARAYHIPPLTARPHEEKLLGSPARIHFPAGSQAPKTPMAEPTDTQSRDWNSLPMFSWSRSVIVWTYSAPSVWLHARCRCTVYSSATGRLFSRHPAC